MSKKKQGFIEKYRWYIVIILMIFVATRLQVQEGAIVSNYGNTLEIGSTPRISFYCGTPSDAVTICKAGEWVIFSFLDSQSLSGTVLAERVGTLQTSSVGIYADSTFKIEKSITGYLTVHVEYCKAFPQSVGTGYSCPSQYGAGQEVHTFKVVCASGRQRGEKWCQNNAGYVCDATGEANIVSCTQQQECQIELPTGNLVCLDIGVPPQPPPECTEGLTRCSGNIIQACQSGKWTDKTNCFTIGTGGGTCVADAQGGSAYCSISQQCDPPPSCPAGQEAVNVAIGTICPTWGCQDIVPPAVCGDFTCDSTETADTCPKDCDTAPPPICPQVCVEMWKIVDDTCVFVECGSGCGADGRTTFSTKDKCEAKLSSLSCLEKSGFEETLCKNGIDTLTFFTIIIIIFLIFSSSIIVALRRR